MTSRNTGSIRIHHLIHRMLFIGHILRPSGCLNLEERSIALEPLHHKAQGIHVTGNVLGILLDSEQESLSMSINSDGIFLRIPMLKE